jgi:predicted Zn-dependent protease with MMP-like domain
MKSVLSGSCFPCTFTCKPMNRIAFEKLVQQSLKRLPRRFKQKIKNISIEVEDRPSAALLKEMNIQSGTLFGLYQGVPLTEREWNYGNMLPDRIVIYQQPIEAAASSHDEIETIVLDTVMHEIGHYFGFGDDELYFMEREKLKKRDDEKLRS